MAHCNNFKDMKVRRPKGATEISDAMLLRALKTHADPKFWKKWRPEPDRYAYIRRWSSVLRREARQRGLL